MLYTVINFLPVHPVLRVMIRSDSPYLLQGCVEFNNWDFATFCSLLLVRNTVYWWMHGRCILDPIQPLFNCNVIWFFQVLHLPESTFISDGHLHATSCFNLVYELCDIKCAHVSRSAYFTCCNVSKTVWGRSVTENTSKCSWVLSIFIMLLSHLSTRLMFIPSQYIK